MAAKLQQSLTLIHLIFYGVGTIIGAGVYSVIGAAAGIAGPHVWISLVLAGCAAFITALSYAELVSAMPRAGAEYHFLKAAFPTRRLPGFLVGYLIMLHTAATSATVALAFAGYLNVFLPVPAILTAFGLLALCTVVNIAGIRESTWASIAMVCIEVGGLLLLIGAVFLTGEPTRAVEWPSAGDTPGIFAATALVFFIYIGFEDMANLAEESRQPERDVPRALLGSVVLTTFIYLLLIWAVLAIIEPARLASSDSPLTTAAAGIAPWLGKVLAVAALFSTASTALIALVSISRLIFGMARDGSMPAPLAKTLEKRKTPWVAALALFMAACALLPLGKVKILASISSLGIMMVFIGVQVALIVLRFRQPDLPRPFSVPGRIGRLPVLPLVGICISAALITQFEPVVYLVASIALMIGGILFMFLRGGDRAG